MLVIYEYIINYPKMQQLNTLNNFYFDSWGSRIWVQLSWVSLAQNLFAKLQANVFWGCNLLKGCLHSIGGFKLTCGSCIYWKPSQASPSSLPLYLPLSLGDNLDVPLTETSDFWSYKLKKRWYGLMEHFQKYVLLI